MNLLFLAKSYIHSYTDKTTVAEVASNEVESAPKIIFVSTAVRNSQSSSATGFLYKIDFRRKKILIKRPISLAKGEPFWNDRGGNRGGRGIVIKGKTVIHATSNSIQFFDLDLKLLKEIKHNYLGSNHEICLVEDGIWVTSTLHDLVVKLDFNGKILDEWWGSESSYLQNQLRFSKRKINLDLKFEKDRFDVQYAQYANDERLHVNAVNVWNNKVYVLANRERKIIQIRPYEKLIMYDQRLNAPHNLVLLKNSYAINDTRNQTVRIYDINTGLCKKSIETKRFTKANPTYSYAGGWQRGLAKVDENTLLVGTSPAEVFLLDIKKSLITHSMKIEEDPHHAVHGLAIFS